MSFNIDLSSSQPIRKRKHSDDPTAIASGASTPGHHASPPSHTVSASSTPPSSIPSMSASPLTAKPFDGDDSEHAPSDTERPAGHVQPRKGKKDHFLKRRRVYDVDDNHEDENGTSGPGYPEGYSIIIGDDDEYDNNEEENNDNGGDCTDRGDSRFYVDENDALSNQADDEDSIVEVYGGSPAHSIIGLSSSGDVSGQREPSPAATHLSEGSDSTITPNTIGRAAGESRSLNRQSESSTTPRPRALPSGTTVGGPDVEEVIEVIDLTRPERRVNYPRGDSLPRVSGLTPQHSFHLPTLQRLVSRSSESVERSQSRRANQSHSSIDILEIPDDEEEENDNNGDDDDRFGNDTVRIDSDVREVQLDPHHPWARGPIQLILSPERPAEDEYLEGQSQRRLEDAILVEDHLPQIDYEDIESESDVEEVGGSQDPVEMEDDGVTDGQVQEEVNWILNLRRDDQRMMSPPGSRRRRAPSFPASPPFEPRSYSFEARPSPFPTSSRRSATPASQHRFSPVARRPSPVPLILREPSLPRSPPARSSPYSFNRSYSVGSSTQSTPKALKMKVEHATVQSVPVSWINQNLRCSICLEVMVIPTMTRCGHAFCRDCILQAVDTAKVCPMCRAPITRAKLSELEFFVKTLNTNGNGAHGGSGEDTKVQ
ncbi:hypothetical protein BGZ54_010149 [Gamsiella multidivaricata]|nr:hypothetical protein BGZ54_010149 [Gamsiella multidivaricata]